MGSRQCFLADCCPQAATGRVPSQGFPSGPVFLWAECQQTAGCHLHLSVSESAKSSRGGSYQRGTVQQSWRKRPSRAARDLHPRLGKGTESWSPWKAKIQESLPQHRCWSIHNNTMIKVNRVLNYRVVIPSRGSNDYRKHLSSAALVWQPYTPGCNYNPVVWLSCLALFFLPMY